MAALTGGMLVTGKILAAALQGKKKILLRSSWQTVNIGDIGHTPGVLALLEKHVTEAEVFLWPMDIRFGVAEMMRKRFPKLNLVETSEEKAKAFAECDFLLHGSGPSLVAAKDVAAWKEQTHKPYGIFGITFPGFYGEPTEAQKAALSTNIDLLTHASFCYFRDSPSLDFAKSHGVSSPVMAFGPDGAFAVDLANDPAAKAFMQNNGLESGKFMCAIPRTRFTPYWEIPHKNTPFNPEKAQRNKEMMEHDIGPIREAVIQIVRNTDLKVLVCPEDSTQVKLGKEQIIDKLPDDIKNRVVWKDTYWLTDEAVSTYRHSVGLFGLEMHSPIMCIGNGIPAVVCRYQEQTSKGIMWRDIGLGEWLFDMDKPAEVAHIVPTVMEIAKNPDAAKKKALKAKAYVDQLMAEGIKRTIKS
ncbi:Polysaccharide pyruvyl transferase [bacterium A37T11]|nr:Polysaccharide pyruvyl transferase [bacterium A37T11]